jgi:hypothetical protein
LLESFGWLFLDGMLASLVMALVIVREAMADETKGGRRDG